MANRTPLAISMGLCLHILVVAQTVAVRKQTSTRKYGKAYILFSCLRRPWLLTCVSDSRFKIWEAGLISGTWGEGHWAMTDFDSDGIMDIPVPASLKSGKYLMRHEALNLQTGPAQFFMNCIQLDVSGSGNSLPQPEKLVSFPGAYDDVSSPAASDIQSKSCMLIN